MSNFILSIEDVNELSGRTMLSETAQSFIIERALVGDHPIDFQVTVGLVGVSSQESLLWYADVQPDAEQMKGHPRRGFNSMLTFDIVDTSRALLAAGVHLTRNEESVDLIPRIRILDIPVVRMLMTRDTTPDLKFMPKVEGQSPLVIPSLTEIETVRRSWARDEQIPLLAARVG